VFVKGLLIKGFEMRDKVRTYLKQVDLPRFHSIALIYSKNYLLESVFYPRDVMLAQVLAIVVCPSVCHTPVLSQNG